jgi:hypothetical protein
MVELNTYNDFQAFPKIPRLNRDIVITEKIDGTNAQVIIDDGLNVSAASRNRFISPDDDNMGFAKWVQANSEDLKKLGPGRHYGEWWGQGIQRNYGLKEKRFSLFNVERWTPETIPTCCHVVPVLYKGAFSHAFINGLVAGLNMTGSIASPGYMNPEGVIVFHTAARAMFKVTCVDDESPKSLAVAA